jgi:hypothetical protein
MKAAYLTTRFINEIQRETLNEILVTSEGRLSPITLLKGSSTGTDLYPQPYLRVMRDLDVLVDPGEQPKLEKILLELGFRQQSKNSHEFYAKHHHSMPSITPVETSGLKFIAPFSLPTASWLSSPYLVPQTW